VANDPLSKGFVKRTPHHEVENIVRLANGEINAQS
jgi:hypothetical protein